MRKGEHVRERMLGHLAKRFRCRREAIGNMRLAKRKTGMLSQGTPPMNSLVRQVGSEGISTLSAIAYGFMGSQALFAALELGLFTMLSDSVNWQFRHTPNPTRWKNSAQPCRKQDSPMW